MAAPIVLSGSPAPGPRQPALASGVIPTGFVQDLLARTDVVEVVGRHVELKKGGANYMGLCPFHGEKSPSFSVSPSKQFYYCFGCHASGDAIRFLTEHLGISFHEAVEDLAQRAGLVVPDDGSSAQDRERAQAERKRQATLTEVLHQAAEHYRKQLKATPRAVQYLKKRGLTGQVAADFGLGYAPEGWRSLASAFAHYDDPLLAESGMVIVQGEEGPDQKRYDRFRDRIMFPIRNVKGETIAFGGRVLDQGEPKYLNSPETPVFSKGRELYGLFEARGGLREKGYALVTEGYMDVVALAQLGFPNAVATLGTACTAEHVHKLLRFTDQVVFSFDGDAAGRRAAGRALEAALPHASDTRSFRFLFLPPEHDPDSYIRAHGGPAFEACVRDAVPLSRQLVEQASADCDLTTAEGRSRMLAQARPLWLALPEGSLRLQLLSELARQGGVPSDELLRLWQHSAPARHGGAQEGGPAGETAGARGGDRRHGRRQTPGDMTPAFRGGRRPPPKGPEDRVVQMLYGQPDWWHQLTLPEQDTLHQLRHPHGPAIAWLERELAEHGPRPWAVLREAMLHDEDFLPEVRALVDGEADFQVSLDDLHSSVGTLMLAQLDQQLKELAGQPPGGPDYFAQLRELTDQRKALKARLQALTQRASRD